MMRTVRQGGALVGNARVVPLSCIAFFLASSPSTSTAESPLHSDAQTALQQPHSADGRTLSPPPEREPLYSKGAALGALGGFYGALYTWTYFAWYRKRAKSDHLVFIDEGWFGRNTYAGGADKLGHAWANYGMNRLTANALEAGGISPGLSSAVGTVGTLGFFTFIEFKDGYHKDFGFSWGDMAFNTMGNALAVALTNLPSLDDAIDFRVEYEPTTLFVDSLRRKGAVDAGEDYSGQTFLLAYHLNSLPCLRRTRAHAFMRFLDVTLGYGTRNFLPKPRFALDTHRQVSLGVAVNFQQVIDTLYGVDPGRRGHGQGSWRMAAELLAVPRTNLPLLTVDAVSPPPPKLP